MKNFIIILVIIIALVLGYQIISKNQPVEMVKSPEEQIPIEQTKMLEQTIVEYTEGGFEPKTLTVPVGTTVEFTNNSDNSLWIASNPHPVHTDLLVFDQKEGMEKGKSYSFTFTQKGSWGYHNHLIPKDKGVVAVE